MRAVAAVTQKPSVLLRRGGPDSRSLKNPALKLLQICSKSASAVVLTIRKSCAPVVVLNSLEKGCVISLERNMLPAESCQEGYQKFLFDIYSLSN